MPDIFFNEFVWDSDKEEENIKNHDGISFEQAIECFEDNFALTFEDLGDYGERRFKMFARDFKDYLLCIIYTERRNGDIIRLISARYAEPFEIKIYENYR